MPAPGPLAWVFGGAPAPVYARSYARDVTTEPLFSGALVEVPTRTDGTWWYEIAVDLVDGTWLLELAYLEVPACWFLTVRGLDGTVLAAGARVVTNFPLFFGRAVFPGVLVCFDSSGTGPPGLTELGPGARCSLLYAPAAT